jgi:hypothetical protein
MLNKKAKRQYFWIGFLIGLGIIFGPIVGHRLVKRIKHGSFHTYSPSEWTKPKKAFNLYFASSLDRIFKDGSTLTAPNFKADAYISAAQNEYESFQIVISNGKKALKSVSLLASDMSNFKSPLIKIGKDNIVIRTIGYVPTKKPYYPVKFIGEWPDPLLPQRPVNINAFETQPFWITVYVPKGTPAGTYNGNILVKTETTAQEVPITLEVFNFEIPTESSLKTAFDFYPHILKLRHPGKSQAELDVIGDEYIFSMLRHRMNPVLNVDPTSNYEMSKVDRYRVLGLNNFSIGKKGGTFNNNWPAGDADIEALLPLYRTYGEMLTLYKLIDYTYIYTWDEGDIGNPQVTTVTSMIKRAFPKLKNMVCYHGIWDPEQYPDWGKWIDIWTFQISDFSQKKMDVLKKLGIEIWMYVSGPSGDATPNLAMDFDSIDYRIIPWLCWKYEIKGFLYWCVNWWEQVDPYVSAANTKWEQNGNGLLFYPGQDGPVDSLRAEIFRDGMEDYEYLVMLKMLVDNLNKMGKTDEYIDLLVEAKNILEIHSIVNSMTDFTKDTDKLQKTRTEIAELISKLNSIYIIRKQNES